MNSRIKAMFISLLLASAMVLGSCAAVFASDAEVFEVDGVLYEEPASGDAANEEVVCEHEWSEWAEVVKPTYFAAGLSERICGLCGASETAEIAKKTARNRWVKDSGKRYYFNSKGKVVKGWHKIKASNKKTAALAWCYFGKKGGFKKKVKANTRDKWVKVGKKRFYFTDKMKPAKKGFRLIHSRLYYFDKDRSVVRHKFKVGKRKYTPNKKTGEITGIQYYIYRYKTFVLVDISKQKLYFYKKGRKKFTADVITGLRGVHDTPRGTFHIVYKKRNITLMGGAYVHYWMAFIGSSYGLHDAINWRSNSQFSNHNTYKYNGSHGCINMRYKDAARLYRTAPTGTKVIVQS